MVNLIVGLKTIRAMLCCLSIFSTPLWAMKFCLWYANKFSDVNIISIGIKESKIKVGVRRNTTDVLALYDTFYMKYHVPPVQLREDAIIVDLGANAGYTMMHFSFLYPQSHVYGVEMDYDNFVWAKKNLSDLKEQCNLIHSAVWSDDGHIKYNKEGSQLAYRVLFEDIQKERNVLCEVQAKTLDTIFNEFKLKTVDYLKMDIEGAEKFILEIPGKWIDIVKSMKIELHPPADLSTCIQTLQKYGFRCSKDVKHTNAIIAIRDF